MGDGYPPGQLYIVLAISATVLSVSSGVIVGSDIGRRIKHHENVADVVMLAMLITAVHLTVAVSFRMVGALPEDILLGMNLVAHLIALLAILSVMYELGRILTRRVAKDDSRETTENPIQGTP